MTVRTTIAVGSRWIAALALAVVTGAGAAAAGPVDGLCAALARQAERAEGIPPGLVEAVALTESGRWFAADGATRLWGGRFVGGPAEALARRSVSVQFDWRLAPYDLAASRAHARVRAQADLLGAAAPGSIMAGRNAME